MLGSLPPNCSQQVLSEVSFEVVHEPGSKAETPQPGVQMLSNY